MKRVKRKKRVKRNEEHADVFRRFAGPALEPESSLARNQAALHLAQVAWNAVQLDRRSDGNVDEKRATMEDPGVAELFDFLVARRRDSFGDHDWFVEKATLAEVDGVVVMSIETAPPKKG